MSRAVVGITLNLGFGSSRCVNAVGMPLFRFRQNVVRMYEVSAKVYSILQF